MLVVIFQHYVPSYREPFFDQLAEELQKHGISLQVFHGRPSGAQGYREDEVHSAWSRPSASRTLQLGIANISTGLPGRSGLSADAVIAPLEGNNLLPYRLLARRSGRSRVGLWGHVRSYVTDGHRVDRFLEKHMMLRAGHIFAYTRSGADHAVSLGIAPDRVTAVMNSVDVSYISNRLSAHAPSAPREKDSFLFLGGLDEAKRIEFLAAALEDLWRLEPRLKLYVGGAGAQQYMLTAAVDRGQVVYVGRVGGREKADLLLRSSAILMPGRIGLIAVEAIAAGIPIISTRWPYHAPEIEYLTEGHNLLMADNSVDSFVDLVRSFRTSEQLPLQGAYPTLENMVLNFKEGIFSLLD